MSNIQVQLRRGTTAQHGSFTGAQGELTVDTDKNALVLHDGATAGGKNLSEVTATGSTTARSLESRFADVVNVLDYGVVADGVTDNTSAYTAMISAVAEGSTIVFPKGSYKGDFISSKSFRLQGNDSTIIPVSNSAGCFTFQGSLGSYTSLSAAPAYGDITLSGVTGLTGDTLLSLYSGNQRPSDNATVNYETVLVKSDGSVIDKIYSDQDGGTPTYAVITPLSGIVIDGFHFEMGDVAMNGIYIQYAKDVRVSNISMNQGRQYTVSIRNAYNVTVDHVRRYKPTATGSGQGYNVGVLFSKYVKVDSVYGEGCRHDYDQDSTYVAEINRVISVDAFSDSIILAHNGFAGFTTVTNATIRGNSYAISTSRLGAVSGDDLLGRHFKIDGVNITNTVDMSSNNFYVGVYFQYPTEDLEIRNVNITNANNPESFDYVGGNFNSGYRVIKIYETRQNCLIENIKADSVGQIVWFDQNSAANDSNTGAIIRNISVKRFVYIAAVSPSVDNGSLYAEYVLDNIKYYQSSTIYGHSIFYFSGTSKLRSLIIRGTELSPYTDIISLPNSGAPFYGHVETAGQTLSLSSLNSLTSGGTITQYDYLVRGELAIWGSNSITLNATTPIEKPVSRGNIFSIWNYHPTNVLTIPANSDTVTNTSDITIAPGERVFFQPNSDGDKWLLMAVMTSGTMTLTT